MRRVESVVRRMEAQIAGKNMIEGACGYVAL